MTNLERIRLDRGISKYRLAKDSGISATHIAYLENGERSIEDMSVRNLKKLAKGLKVNFTDLLD